MNLLKKYIEKHIDWIKKDPWDWLTEYYLLRYVFFVMIFGFLTIALTEAQINNNILFNFVRILVIIIWSIASIASIPLLIVIVGGYFSFVSNIASRIFNINQITDELSEIKNLLNQIEKQIALQNNNINKEVNQIITSIKNQINSQSQNPEKEKLEKIAQLLKELKKELDK